jgi:hypothetical protein
VCKQAPTPSKACVHLLVVEPSHSCNCEQSHNGSTAKHGQQRSIVLKWRCCRTIVEQFLHHRVLLRTLVGPMLSTRPYQQQNLWGKLAHQCVWFSLR